MHLQSVDFIIIRKSMKIYSFFHVFCKIDSFFARFFLSSKHKTVFVSLNYFSFVCKVSIFAS